MSVLPANLPRRPPWGEVSSSPSAPPAEGALARPPCEGTRRSAAAAWLCGEPPPTIPLPQFARPPLARPCEEADRGSSERAPGPGSTKPTLMRVLVARRVGESGLASTASRSSSSRSFSPLLRPSSAAYLVSARSTRSRLVCAKAGARVRVRVRVRVGVRVKAGIRIRGVRVRARAWARAR